MLFSPSVGRDVPPGINDGIPRRLPPRHVATPDWGRRRSVTLTQGVEVGALEETAETIYLVLPPVRSGEVQAGELSDLELETVAGGWNPNEISSVCRDPNCSNYCAL
jgi:hypothetical protein